MKTPILFLIFNRPEVSTRVFEEIKRARPSELFIAADGPREDRAGENELCRRTRAVTENIDWPCKVHRKYAEKNLDKGTGRGVHQSISWFFDHVERGIILEDDCLPNPSFFPYCDELLDRYKNKKEVMMISGNDMLLHKKIKTKSSYYFTRHCHTWGWATWRRAWKRYETDMESYPEFKKQKKIARIFKNPKMQKHWLDVFDRLYSKRVDSWDARWVYTIFKNGGLSIAPTVNLICNIGFGNDATHTTKNSPYSERKTYSLNKIIHPKTIEISKESERIEEKEMYPCILIRIINKLKKIFR